MKKIPDIRDAATIVLVRSHNKKNLVLMGRRGSRAAFMPSKYVFPGGAWEPEDNSIPIAEPLNEKDKTLLAIDTKSSKSSSLGVTAIRELWEETGLRISSPIGNVNIPKNWIKFFLNGCGPNLKPLKFFFRAITPPGRTRRFDARFFVCNASHISDNLDNFDNASNELNDLRWVDIRKVSNLNLPQITRIAIEETIKLIDSKFERRPVPFYTGGSEGSDNKLLEI